MDCAGECYEWPEPAGPATHTITDLGTLGGLEALGYAINNYGDAVGESGATDGTRHATLWADGEVIDLGPPDVWSWGEDINNHRQVVVNHSNKAFMWKDGELIPLGGLNPGGSATGNAINDAGQIVGWSYVGIDVANSFIWQEGLLTNLSETVGLAAAEDINSLGYVGGTVAIDASSWHAALLNGEVVTDLGTLGGQSSGASGINDLSQVIGVSERAPGGDRVFYGFFWDGEEMHDAADLVGYDARVRAINNCGEILLPGTGRSNEGFYIFHADRGLRPVRGVCGPATGWWDLSASDMNDAGEIVGHGLFNGRGRAFLIAPVRGDLDWDGDCDLQDFAAFTTRVTGPLEPDIPGCQRADIDRDGDVDLVDFRAFQWVFSGGS